MFLEPIPVFHYPKWSIIFVRLSLTLKLRCVKSLIKWYLRYFVINKVDDAKMVSISSNAIDNSDPCMLRKTVPAIYKYSAWHKMHSIDCPVLIFQLQKILCMFMHIRKN
jgi:hypothetical protein